MAVIYRYMTFTYVCCVTIMWLTGGVGDPMCKRSVFITVSKFIFR